jgi:hypothetical protein
VAAARSAGLAAPAAADLDDPSKAAAAAAAEIAVAACKASAGVAAKGPASCPVQVTPAVLQSLIARPLVAVQTSLLMDTVAWQRGVLATPPVSHLQGHNSGCLRVWGCAAATGVMQSVDSHPFTVFGGVCDWCNFCQGCILTCT